MGGEQQIPINFCSILPDRRGGLPPMPAAPLTIPSATEPLEKWAVASASSASPHCRRGAIGAGVSEAASAKQEQTSDIAPQVPFGQVGIARPVLTVIRNRPLTEAGYGAFDMKTTSLRILHTSDWHIGRTLYGRRRYETFSAFLDWLADTVRDRHVDVLIVAGDVFDTSAPSNRAQELYYRFLCRVMSFCRHIVVVAGNHDSPSFLTAPKELLRALNVHVVGSISDDPDFRSFGSTARTVSPSSSSAPSLISDRDIQVFEPAKALKTRRNLIDGIRATTPPSARRPKRTGRDRISPFSQPGTSSRRAARPPTATACDNSMSGRSHK
ncbi:MAG: metallophosphoesterase family protein [Bilophila wadsworthia]